ncbi:MAG: signal peptidase I [bacterium]|nr:signal peptidase I [bacterium]
MFDNFKRNIGIYAAATGLFLLEFIKLGLVAFITIFLVRYFLFKPFYVKGASMEPNFHESEYLIIDELSYRLHEPNRGDVIVFKYPENPSEYFLKRIIGLPGESVKISEGNVTIYNKAHPEGVAISESYLPDGLKTIGERVTKLNDNQFFVLGDNRPNSHDSRGFGPVDRGFLVGRAWLRGWPPSRVEVFKTPSFNF